MTEITKLNRKYANKFSIWYFFKARPRESASVITLNRPLQDIKNKDDNIHKSKLS